MKIAIIESGGANFLSVATAFERLNVKCAITHEKEIILAADAVILPGVGSAGYAMATLKNYRLKNLICELTQPVLGICLGMQLLYEYTQEDETKCLGIIPGDIEKFMPRDDLVVPHMGWNNLDILANDKIVNNVTNNENVYFVHSYFAGLSQYTIASCNYGKDFSAVVKYNNFYGMQFHPEKSGKIGEQLIKNFLESI